MEEVQVSRSANIKSRCFIRWLGRCAEDAAALMIRKGPLSSNILVFVIS